MSRSKQTWLIHYRYDPLDKVASHSTPDAPELHRFYCKNRLTTELQGGVGHTIFQHENLLLAQQRHENDMFDTTLLATDPQRSVLQTLKPNEQQPIAYSPYGHRPPENGLSSLLGFNGERPDEKTGHYLLGNGYRGFSTLLMRFIGPDTLSPFGRGGLNAYAYCKDDPINFTDPSGHITNLFRKPINFIYKQIQRKQLNNELSLISKRHKADKGVDRYINSELAKTQRKMVNDIYELPTTSNASPGRIAAFGDNVPPASAGAYDKTLKNEMLRHLDNERPFVLSTSPDSVREQFIDFSVDLAVKDPSGAGVPVWRAEIVINELIDAAYVFNKEALHNKRIRNNWIALEAQRRKHP